MLPVFGGLSSGRSAIIGVGASGGPNQRRIRCMPRDLYDHYFKQAKREGYRSRAAYKLIQIDDKRHILKKHARVLDCGCAPGSWLQVAAKRVGAGGIVVGIDLKEIDPLPDDNVFIIAGDLTRIMTEQLLEPIRLEPTDTRTLFDAVISDMAPATTGDRNIDHHGSIRLCESLLGRCGDVLSPGGSLVMKVFEGEAYPDLLRQTKMQFGKVKGFRPPASRHESTEMFIIAEAFRAAAGAPTSAPHEQTEDADAPAQGTSAFLPAPPKPRSGWGN